MFDVCCLGILVADVTAVPVDVDAVIAGADSLVLTYEIFNQLFDHPLTELGIQKFTSDYNKIYNI